MEPIEHKAEVQKPHAAQDAAHAAPEPKRRGRPPGSKNKPKQNLLSRLLQTQAKAAALKTPAPPAEAPVEASAAGVPGGAQSAGLRRLGVSPSQLLPL